MFQSLPQVIVMDTIGKDSPKIRGFLLVYNYFKIKEVKP